MSHEAPDPTTGPPPREQHPRVSPWDDWLLQRPNPTGAGPIRFADVVAMILRSDGGRGVDFGVPSMREGMRQLFDEYEEAIAGRGDETPHDAPAGGTGYPGS